MIQFYSRRHCKFSAAAHSVRTLSPALIRGNKEACRVVFQVPPSLGQTARAVLQSVAHNGLELCMSAVDEGRPGFTSNESRGRGVPRKLLVHQESKCIYSTHWQVVKPGCNFHSSTKTVCMKLTNSRVAGVNVELLISFIKKLTSGGARSSYARRLGQYLK